MYMDSIVAYGLVIVFLACVMITYVGIYAYKHIKADTERAERELGEKSA